MLHHPPKTRLISSAALALGTLVTGCATNSVRAVVDVVPIGLSYSLETLSAASAEVPAAPDSVVFEGGALPNSLGENHEQGSDDPAGSELFAKPTGDDFIALDSTFGPGNTQLNPALGPVDLGWPLLIDLGAGEYPYDDGVPTIHVEESRRSGFSDSLIQVTWREAVTTSTKFHATMAMTRFQDLGLIDGAPDMRLAWFAVGFSCYL